MRKTETGRSIRAVLAAGALVAGTGIAAGVAAQDITVTTYGGIWEEAIQKCYADEFERRTGYKANVLIGAPAQWMSQIEANPDNPPIHVLIGNEPHTIAAGEAGLIERATEEQIPEFANVSDQFKDVVDGWGACFDYGAFVITYHKDRVKNPPTSIKEFVERTIAGDWVASMPSINYAISPQALVWNLADLYGGGVDDISPAIEVAKRMYDSGNTITWAGVTDYLNQLQTGDADIGLYWDGRAWAFIDQGNDWMGVQVPSDGPVMTCVAMSKVKNAPESAWEYLRIVFEPGPMGCFSEHLQYGVTNENVVYSDRLRERITPWEVSRLAPAREVGERMSDWIEQWNREVGR